MAVVRSSINFGRARAAMEESIPGALRAAADVIGSLSDSRAPYETGELVDSRYERVEGHRIEIGYSAYYAEWQHERTDYNHPGGRRAKFLETALVDGRAAAKLAIRTELARGLDG